MTKAMRLFLAESRDGEQWTGPGMEATMFYGSGPGIEVTTHLGPGLSIGACRMEPSTVVTTLYSLGLGMEAMLLFRLGLGTRSRCSSGQGQGQSVITIIETLTEVGKMS
jgi:hypothetical protein